MFTRASRLSFNLSRALLSRAKSSAAVTLPGRLGDPSLSLATDPRTHPGVNKLFGPFELNRPQLEAPPVSQDCSYEAKVEWANGVEQGFGGLFDTIVSAWPPIEGVENSTEIIKGVDGNDITLYISKPKNSTGPMPCMYHTHGGGMTVSTAADSNYRYWRDIIASTGMVVVGVEFRNAGGRLGPHPFPAGLNDCFSGLQWTHENKGFLEYSKLIISGESGGGNLSLATTLKAKQHGKLAMIDGVYAMCPYIYGNWGVRCPSLPSLVENDGYFLGCDMMAVLANLYDMGVDKRNPLTWPYWAKDADLAGLPPVVISVNELDPLRDEGLAFFRKLNSAGVAATARTVIGTPHGGDGLLFCSAPELCMATVRDIRAFAGSL